VIEVSVLIDKLNGMSADDIWRYMAAEKVRGDTQIDTSCVLANWIRRESGEYVAVGVHSESGDGKAVMGIRKIEPEEPDLHLFEFFPLNAEVGRFISEFDNGRYPDLVTEYDTYD
jgi:hypothetical protein